VTAPEPTEQPSGGQQARLVLSWLIVGIPLIYGVYMTIKSVLPLF
jgi:hypothetical protein